VIVFRIGESREPSPETTPADRANDGVDQVTTDTMPSIDITPADGVIDDEGRIHLPEPPDLGAFVLADTSLPSDTAHHLSEDNHVEPESASVDASESKTTVPLGFLAIEHNRNQITICANK